MRWTATIVAFFAISAGLLALVVRDREAVGADDTSAAPSIATGAANGAAIANPFSNVPTEVATRFHHDDKPLAPFTAEPTVLDTSQDLHIAESQRNYRSFLTQPDGYLKYEALAGVHHQDVSGLDKVVYDHYLSYHGRLAVEEMRYQISTNPLDHAGNAERYVKMLDIIARAPCPPDEHWDGCISQSLGITRTDVEKAQADESILRDQRNLAQLKLELTGRVPGARLPMALYESLTPLLVRTLDGDEETIRRFGLAAEGANEIIATVNEYLSGEPLEGVRDLSGAAAQLKP